MQKRWDIFCNVVDNYGDAGVCWRLARQLAAEFDIRVRLWIDDLAALQKLQPAIAMDCVVQQVDAVEIRPWCNSFSTAIDTAEVVIEAFACALPPTYLVAMRAQHALCINLEYLSAEEWVAGCHGLPSPQSEPLQKNGALQKFFFFPGFREGTGGVLGERDVRKQCRAFQADASARRNFLRRIGIERRPSDALLVSLFSYAAAPIESLLKTWAAGAQPIMCLVPEGQPLRAVENYCGDKLRAGSVRQLGALTVCVVPFLSQVDYDYLLWCCDLNFVRGEDSFVRAQWAGLPLVWQIYAQADGAHWPKLDAFLQLYCAELPPSAVTALDNFWRAWNGAGDVATAWPAFARALPALRAHAGQWAERLAAGTNLAAALVQFCANQV